MSSFKSNNLTQKNNTNAYSAMISLMNRKNRVLYKKMLSSLAFRGSEGNKERTRNYKAESNGNFNLKNSKYKNSVYSTYCSTNISNAEYNTLKYEKKPEKYTQLKIEEKKKKNENFVNTFFKKNFGVSFPFNIEEKRFEWQNLDESTKIVSLKDFYYTIPRKVSKENGAQGLYTSKRVKKETQRKHFFLTKSYDNIQIKKILYPDKYPYTPSYIPSGRRRVNLSCDLLHTSTGSFDSLFNRTPLCFPLRFCGKKKVLPNVKDSLYLFDENYFKPFTTKNHRGNIENARKFFHFDHFKKGTGLSLSSHSMEDFRKRENRKRNIIRRCVSK